jgi:hypothetical protein
LNDNHTHTDSGLKVTGFILKMNFRKNFLKKTATWITIVAATFTHNQNYYTPALA